MGWVGGWMDRWVGVVGGWVGGWVGGRTWERATVRHARGVHHVERQKPGQGFESGDDEDEENGPVLFRG